MKLISWNVNGIRSILGQNKKRKYDKVSNDNLLFAYIDKEQPDVMMIQETKAEREQINEELRAPEDYHAFYHSSERKKGWSGVLTYSKKEPNKVIRKIGIDDIDAEGRILQTDFDDLSVLNIYFPNGTSGMERVNFKLYFYDKLFEYCESLRKDGNKIIISGDYNTAHHEIDLARPKQNVNTSGFLPEEREKIDKIIDLGYVDTFRMFESGGEHYTWWSQRGRARENNVGWRIDYHMVTDDIKDRVSNSYHQPEVHGSDHCPIVMNIED